ncbi:MAG: sporulation protein YqfD [Candidatus Coproplasma sp.]
MNNIVVFEVTAQPEVALKKLAMHKIPVFTVKKRGSKLCFGVKREYIEKVFAIFAHPCYNTVIRRKSFKMRLSAFVKNRFAIIVGAFLFLASTLFSQSIVFKIKITGNADYLSPQIMELAQSCGVKEWSLCRTLDKALLQSQVLALDGVEFCHVQRQGAYLIIDVHASQNQDIGVSYSPLKSSVTGTIYRLVAVCGTAQKEVGDKVKIGDTLIDCFEVNQSGQRLDCLAVGFAEIEVESEISLIYDCESEQNTLSALSAPSIYSERVIKKSYTVNKTENGVEYIVNFSYLVTDSINME